MNALSREQLIAVIEGRAAGVRVPLLYHSWISPERFAEKGEEVHVRALLREYPMDAQVINWCGVSPYDAPADDPSFRWMHHDAPPNVGTQALDAQTPLSDWGMLDDMLADFPDPNYPGLFPNAPTPDGRYRVAYWWFTFFERHWSLRGMSNALLDFLLYPNETHRLFEALCRFYCRMVERAGEELNADAVYFTDDLGTQSGPFFSPAIFEEFFAPYYQRIIATAHARGMHAWMHTCGNVTLFLPRLIELGLDVIHPIQKYAMDERHVVREFGGAITFLAGFDVQQIIPYGTPDDVRREVRHLIDTYQRPGGRLMLTAGNALTPDTPLASLQALFEESARYGINA